MPRKFEPYLRRRVFAVLRRNRRTGAEPRSLRQIALKFGFSRSYLTMILNGERYNTGLLAYLESLIRG